MTPALELLGGDTLVVSPSQLETLKTCPRMWLYRYLHRRVKVGVFAARDGGKAFDAAMNLRYTTLGSAPVIAGGDIETQMKAAIDDGFAGLDLLEEYRTPVLYKTVLDAYNKQWGREPFDVIGVQVPMAVPLGTVHNFQSRINVVLQGIPDMLVRLPDGNTYVWDSKTMNDWSDRKLVEWENNSQTKAYAWGFQELARLHPELGLPERISGFMLNAIIIRKPSDSTRVKLPRIEFRRPIFLYTQEQLEEWRIDTLAWIGMALQWVADDHFPQNEKSCANHYGKACPYLGVCTFPKRQREMILASDEYRDYEHAPQFATVGASKIVVDKPSCLA